MSMVVREQGSGRVLLLCKGADNVMFERIARAEGGGPDAAAAVASGEWGAAAGSPVALITPHLSEFARDGLRTLVLAIKELHADAAARWQTEYNAANVSLVDRWVAWGPIGFELSFFSFFFFNGGGGGRAGLLRCLRAPCAF